MKIRMLTCWLALALSVANAYALDERVHLTTDQIQHLRVTTIKPAMTHRMPLLRAPATVTLPPQNEYVVSAPQAGLVERVTVAIGDKVKTGAPLAQIRSPDLLALQRAVLDASTNLNLAAAKLRRDRTLFDEGIIARIRYHETESDHERAAAALREAEQVLAAAGIADAEIERLKRQRKLDAGLAVRSPIDGVVLERLIAPGQRVDLLAPLFRVGRLDELWLEVAVPAERLDEIRIGDPVAIEDAGLDAHITHVGQYIDHGNQTARVRAIVSRPTETLKPGRHVNVQLLHASTDELFKVPLSALFSHDNHDYLFVRDTEGFQVRAVAVASRDEREAVIHEGLHAGEEIVVQGVAALKAAWVGIGEGEE